MKTKIKATFTTEKANYHKKLGYYNHTYETTEREIEMEIIDRDEKPILRFIGGPTGFESYYISTLLEDSRDFQNFCICGGTVNSWPNCIVPWVDVEEFLRSNGYERSQS